METIASKAREYAVRCHATTNHHYDKDKPYSVHLELVTLVAITFNDLIPREDRHTVFAGCWVHDVIEDCRQTYNDVKEATNKDVAELAYALTNEKGKNRAERGSAKYYKDMHKVKYAIFIKLCDRIANAQYSKESGSGMLKMYAKEHDGFVKKTWDDQYAPMFTKLESIFKS